MIEKWHVVPLDGERLERLITLRQRLRLDERLAHLDSGPAFLLSLGAADLTEFLSIITDKEPEEIVRNFSLGEAARALRGFLDMDILGPYLGLQIERGYKIFGEAG